MRREKKTTRKKKRTKQGIGLCVCYSLLRRVLHTQIGAAGTVCQCQQTDTIADPRHIGCHLILTKKKQQRGGAHAYMCIVCIL